MKAHRGRNAGGYDDGPYYAMAWEDDDDED